jgi:membrane-bound inhibitor of C-type lysozyme
MSDFEPTNPPETPSALTSEQARRPKIRHWLANRRRRWIVVAAALMSAVLGLSVGLATSGSATAVPPVAAATLAGGSRSGGGASNARSGPATGGASGTVGGVSASSFIMTTSAGQKVTVDEASSTTYQSGANTTSAKAITTGETVLALGITNGTTITATQVIVTPAGGAPAASSAAQVIPFQPGAPTTSKQVGQIPANFSQGSGTIVSGTTANKATEAALAAYPGGVVDRVVDLSNGEYNVHYIGVNWPHHVFVNQSFTVVGAL